MSWIEEIEAELRVGVQARAAGNAGLARTCARRAAGMAIRALEQSRPDRSLGSDFIRQLQAFSHDPEIPPDVRDAADRLQARLAPDFSSPSTDPIADARRIVAFVRSRIPA